MTDHTPQRNIRVPNDLWAAAQAKAAAKGTTVSDVLRKYLEGWVKRS